MVGPRPQKAAKKRTPERQGWPGNAGKNPQPTKMEKVEARKTEDEKNDKREEKSMLAKISKQKWEKRPLGSDQNG